MEAPCICTGTEITGGFDIGFDEKIPEATKDELMKFVYWVEDHFPMPITLWADCKYRKYLIDQTGKRSGYRFWWAEFKDYPRFDDPDDIPVIELAVNCSKEDFLPAFTEAITLYYAWLSRKDISPDKSQAAALLQQYLQS